MQCREEPNALASISSMSVTVDYVTARLGVRHQPGGEFQSIRSREVDLLVFQALSGGCPARDRVNRMDRFERHREYEHEQNQEMEPERDRTQGDGWPGLRYSEAPARHTGASEYLSPGHPP